MVGLKPTIFVQWKWHWTLWTRDINEQLIVTWKWNLTRRTWTAVSWMKALCFLVPPARCVSKLRHQTPGALSLSVCINGKPGASHSDTKGFLVYRYLTPTAVTKCLGMRTGYIYWHFVRPLGITGKNYMVGHKTTPFVQWKWHWTLWTRDTNDQLIVMGKWNLAHGTRIWMKVLYLLDPSTSPPARPVCLFRFLNYVTTALSLSV